ncbi:abortive infection family protein (plasmid) [Rhodococcus aetherivorans]|uniref:Abortive infection family protein n=1 Tax=Rhodococcus aetherivorans TaxID=191292 RepID=A0AA46P289_9NOCA|nr:abortive infection family protein [Rhodococcus aetherivorans]UYF97171.1 abortive infection family protein [Rhodococcus aetherivorans]
MTTSKKIDGETRREIQELLLDWGWTGKQNELEFMSSVCELHQIKSNDPRCTTAYEDIEQHVMKFHDWGEGWAFTDPRFGFMGGPDKTVLKFAAHRLSPRVCPDAEKEPLCKALNDLINPCGYELYEREVRAGVAKVDYRSTSNFHPPQPASIVAASAQLGDLESLQLHLKRIERSIAADPSLALGSSKELIEDVCAQILTASNEPVSSTQNVGQKFRAAAKALDLSKTAVPSDPKASDAAAKMLSQLTGTVQFLGELRNAAGTGHGSGKVSAATPREARLAFNAAVTICEYLFSLWEEFDASNP